MTPQQLHQLIQFIVQQTGGTIGGFTISLTIALMLTWYFVIKPSVTKLVDAIATKKIQSVIEIVTQLRADLIDQIAEVKSSQSKDHIILIEFRAEYNAFKDIIQNNLATLDINLSARIKDVKDDLRASSRNRF